MVVEIEEDGSGATYDSSETVTLVFNFTLDGTLDPDNDVYMGRARIKSNSNTDP